MHKKLVTEKHKHFSWASLKLVATSLKWEIRKKQQGNPSIALPNLTLNKHHHG